MSATREAVALEALSWLGTPYHHHGRVKGAGVDCAQILIAVYSGLGLAPEIDPGFYAPDWNLHRSEEIFRRWLVEAGARPVETPERGDVGLFRYGRTASHGAILVDPGEMLFVHSYLKRGVIVSRLSEEPLTGRQVEYWSVF